MIDESLSQGTRERYIAPLATITARIAAEARLRNGNLDGIVDQQARLMDSLRSGSRNQSTTQLAIALTVLMMGSERGYSDDQAYVAAELHAALALDGSAPSRLLSSPWASTRQRLMALRSISRSEPSEAAVNAVATALCVVALKSAGFDQIVRTLEPQGLDPSYIGLARDDEDLLYALLLTIGRWRINTGPLARLREFVPIDTPVGRHIAREFSHLW